MCLAITTIVLIRMFICSMCILKRCHIITGWHQGSDQRSSHIGWTQWATPEPAQVSEGGSGTHQRWDWRDNNGPDSQRECPARSRQVQDTEGGQEGQHEATSGSVRKYVKRNRCDKGRWSICKWSFVSRNRLWWKEIVNTFCSDKTNEAKI